MCGPNQRDAVAAALDADSVVRTEHRGLLAVDRHASRRDRDADTNIELEGIRQHHRPIGQRMRTDRREHDRHRGSDTRSDRRRSERIGGRSGGRRDDQAVGAVGAERLAVGADLYQEHPAGGRGCSTTSFTATNRSSLRNSCGSALHHRIERDPAVDLVVAAATCASSACIDSSTVTWVRNPNPPRLIPRMGVPRDAARRATPSRVPSPPSTTMKSARSARYPRAEPGPRRY